MSSLQNILNQSFPVLVAATYHEWAANNREYLSKARHKSLESSAKSVVRQTANKGFMDKLSKQFQEAGVGEAIVVAPFKENSKNLLARIFANKVAKTFGFDLDSDIIQLPTDKKMHHSSHLERLFTQVSFVGEVRTDVPYIIVDDNVTTGKTMQALKHYIEDHGGSVSYGVSLTSTDGEDIDLAISKDAVVSLAQNIAQHIGQGDGNVFSKLREKGINLLRLTSLQAKHFSAGQGQRELEGVAKEIARAEPRNFGLN